MPQRSPALAASPPYSDERTRAVTNGPVGAATVAANPTSARRVRVVVADDDALVCAGLALLMGLDLSLIHI